jgi:hypothetical protein
MTVVDASVVVKWFVAEKGHEAAIEASQQRDLAAPDRLLLEVANVLARKLKRGDIRVDQASAAIGKLPALIGQVVPSTMILDRAFDLAVRLDHSVYDCAYLACALHLDAELLTADARFADKARRSGFAPLVRDLGEHSTS